MTLTFNGTNIADFSAFWDGSKLFPTPEKDIEFISIPGRNGDLSISNGRYKNLDIEVPCFIRENFSANFRALTNFLLSQDGYGQLETSEEPDVFRMAEFIQAVQPVTGAFNQSGKFSLIFNCKPQKWLKSGQRAISVSSGDIIYNQTMFDALPLIYCEGNGTINVGGYTVIVSGMPASARKIWIDCEMQDAYNANLNYNRYMTLDEFPKLVPGENEITYTGFTSVAITPRWFVL